MIKKIWQYSHLSIALIVSIYIMIASVTGAILGINEVLNPSAESGQSVAAIVQKMQQHYTEVVALKKDDHGNLESQAFDEDYNEIKGMVNLETGAIGSQKIEKPQWIEFTTVLHRSLFLDSTGRYLVGILSVLFFITLVTGLLLMVKTIPVKHHLWTKWRYQNWATTYHHSVGRLAVLPLMILAITASVLFLHRFEYLSVTPSSVQTFEPSKDAKTITVTEFPFLKQLSIKDLKSMDFPFDESENYKIETTEGIYELNFNTGAIASQQLVGNTEQIKLWAYRLHTGQGSISWAMLITLASLSIPGVVLSGLVILKKRQKPTVAHKFSSFEAAETIILYASEGGSTAQQALGYAIGLQQMGEKVYFATMNEWQQFPKMKRLLLLAATYGNGEAPDNGSQFLKKFFETEIGDDVKIAILGLGSKAYPRFNAFAQEVFQTVENKGFGANVVAFSKINDREEEGIRHWEHQVNDAFAWNLHYQERIEKLVSKEIEILEKSDISDENQYFTLKLSLPDVQVNSGDLLRIYIPNTDEYRYYSISVLENSIHLLVKYYPGGRCSEFLKTLKKGDKIVAAVEPHTDFYWNKKPVIFISNGTGIAPFLGMMAQNVEGVPMWLYAGFRYQEQEIDTLHHWVKALEANNQVSIKAWNYTKVEHGCRVTKSIATEAGHLLQHLQKGNSIYLCGALSLKEDVNAILEAELLRTNGKETLALYYENYQIKTDCY